MNKMALTFGSFSLVWVYLIAVSGTQIYIDNQRTQFLLALLVMLILMILSFIIVCRFIHFKMDNTRNQGLKQFSGIYQDRKVSLEFIAANIFPLMNMELFRKVSFETFLSSLVMVGILFVVVDYTQSFAFNPYLYFMKYRIYRTKDSDEVLLLIKKKEFGNRSDYQENLRFEELENSNIYIMKSQHN